MQRLAGHNVDSLSVLCTATFPNFDVVAAGAQIHVLVIVRRACVGAVDEYLSVLHLGIQLYFTGVGIRVVIIGRSPIGSPSPRRSPIWAIPNVVIGASHDDAAADGGRSADRRERHQSSRQNQQTFSHTRPPASVLAITLPDH